MLDTDICSYIMKRAPSPLLSRMEQTVERGHALCISVITYSELRLGAARSPAVKKYNHLIDEFSERLDFIADWTALEADRYAGLQAHLFSRGTPIGQNDTMIAAHALSVGAVLVTNNQKHFTRINKLSVENWA